MKHLLLLSVFFITNLVCEAQVERFPSGTRTSSGEFPEIDGYDAGEPDSVFRQALNEHIFDALEDFYDEGLVFVNGSAEFIVEIEGESVTNVEFIRTNSSLFANYLTPILYALDIKSTAREKVIFHHTVIQPIPCCVKGQQTQVSHALSEVVQYSLVHSGQYSDRELKWMLFLNDGDVDCLMPALEQEAKWTDILVEDIQFIQLFAETENLEDGAYLVKYNPDSVLAGAQVEAFQRQIRELSRGEENKAAAFLSNWMRFTGMSEFSFFRPADTVITIPRDEMYQAYQEGDRWMAVLDHNGMAVMAYIVRGETYFATGKPRTIVYKHFLPQVNDEERDLFFHVVEADKLRPLFVELIPEIE